MSPPSPTKPAVGGDPTPKKPIGRLVLDQTPEEQVVKQRRFDEPRRRQTLTDLHGLKTPGLPLELGQTVRAPSTTSATLPARPDPTGIRIPSDEAAPQPSLAPPSATPDAAALAASRADAERLRIKVAELERNARATAEVRSPVGTFPPPVQRSPIPAPVVSVPPKIDQAIGKSLRYVFSKAAPYLLAAAGIGGGITAVAKPTPTLEKVDATAVRVTEIERSKDEDRRRILAVEDYSRELARVNRCLRKQQAHVNESVTPAPDHFGAARRQEPFIDVCPDDPKPP